MVFTYILSLLYDVNSAYTMVPVKAAYEFEIVEFNQQVSPLGHIWFELLTNTTIIFHAFVLSAISPLRCSGLTRIETQKIWIFITEENLTERRRKRKADMNIFIYLVQKLAASRLLRTDATKKKFLAGRGGIGVSSVEDRNTAPAGWLAAEKMAAEGIFRPVSENKASFVMFSGN